jgi:ATP-dependent RNA helicase DDX19/DBP5
MQTEEGKYSSLIAQSKNGSGKTGAFTVGSVLRVDPKIQKTQVIVLCHIRELAAQIADVYSKIVKFANITVVNHTATQKVNDAQIVVMTLGGLKNALGGRTKTLDLSHLRVMVIDEVDFFFGDERNKTQFYDIYNKNLAKLPQEVQWLLFSATYPEDVVKALDEFCPQAYQINVKNEKLQLDHID